MDTTQQIQVIMHMQFADQLAEIRHQADATGELKRFVKYVFDRTGSFGTVTKKADLNSVNWQTVLA